MIHSAKKEDYITKSQMANNIKDRLKTEFGINLTKKDVQKVLEIEQDEIEYIIATEKAYKYSWGTVRGVQKVPKKIYGYLSLYEGSIANHGYSSWKRGYPKVEINYKMRYCQEYTPDVYFNIDPIKFGTEAREFRKEAGFPEIDEYKNLPEEEIVKLCKEYDEKANEKLSKKEKELEEKRKAECEMIKQKTAAFYKDKDYKPIGAALCDNFDKIESLIYYKIKPENNVIDNFASAREIKIMYEYYREHYNITEHPEVYEIYEKYRKEIEELGVELPPLSNIALKYLNNKTVTCIKRKKKDSYEDFIEQQYKYSVYDEGGNQKVFDENTDTEEFLRQYAEELANRSKEKEKENQ